MVSGGLRRMREMITETGLADLMPTGRRARIEEETRERRVSADVAAVEMHASDDADVAGAPEVERMERMDGAGPEVAGRMSQFAGAVPEVFAQHVTAGLAPEVLDGGIARSAAGVDVRQDEADMDGDETVFVRRGRELVSHEVGLDEASDPTGGVAPEMKARARGVRGSESDLVEAKRRVRGDVVRQPAPSPIADRAAPEVSADTSVDGIAGQSRWRQSGDDVMADVIRRCEAMVERGR